MLTKHTAIIAGITLLALIAASGALGTAFYFIAGAKAKLTEQQVVIAEALLHEQELASLEKLISSSESERAELQGYILNDEDVIDFLSILGTLALEQGIEHDIPSLDAEDIGGGFEELAIVMSVEGSYDGVTRVLALLETLPYRSFVDTVELSRSGGNEATADRWAGQYHVKVIKRTAL